jgi:hypothetical protein
MNNRNEFFINEYDRIFTVKLMWDIAQPFVCGTLEQVVKYALQPNNGIEYFAEIKGGKIKKVSKANLKSMLHAQGHAELSDDLFKKH